MNFFLVFIALMFSLVAFPMNNSDDILPRAAILKEKLSGTDLKEQENASVELYELIRYLIHKRQATSLRKLFFALRPEVNFVFLLNKIAGGRLPSLHFALTRKWMNLAVIKTLINYGADPNIPVENEYFFVGSDGPGLFPGSTAAHIAVKYGASFKILRLLYEGGTDFQKVDSCGRTPLEIARLHKKLFALNFFSYLEDDQLSVDDTAPSDLDDEGLLASNTGREIDSDLDVHDRDLELDEDNQSEKNLILQLENRCNWDSVTVNMVMKFCLVAGALYGFIQCAL